MNSPVHHRESVSPDPLCAFIGMWRLLWGRQLALKRLLLRGGLMLGFTLLTWLAIPPEGRVPDKVQANIFFVWVVGFYFLTLMPLTCLSVCGSMVREEAAANTLCFYTTRPLKRAEMFLLFYFGNIASLQVLFGVLTMMLFGVAGIRGVDGTEGEETAERWRRGPMRELEYEGGLGKVPTGCARAVAGAERTRRKRSTLATPTTIICRLGPG